jgi:hypothetical protein
MAEEKGRQELEAQVVAKAWKDADYRAALTRDPRGTLQREFNTSIPESVTIRVVEEDANTIYLVLPPAPIGAEELTDADLEAVAGGEKKIAIATIAAGATTAAAVIGAGSALGAAAIQNPQSSW